MTIDDLIADLQDLRKKMERCGIDPKVVEVVVTGSGGEVAGCRYATFQKHVEIKTNGER